MNLKEILSDNNKHLTFINLLKEAEDLGIENVTATKKNLIKTRNLIIEIAELNKRLKAKGQSSSDTTSETPNEAPTTPKVEFPSDLIQAAKDVLAILEPLLDNGVGPFASTGNLFSSGTTARNELAKIA